MPKFSQKAVSAAIAKRNKDKAKDNTCSYCVKGKIHGKTCIACGGHYQK